MLFGGILGGSALVYATNMQLHATATKLRDHILPDVLRPSLKVVFSGTAAGNESARRGAYYAGPGNRFWPMLFEAGIVPRLLAPEEFRSVVDFGVGLTDVAKCGKGCDAQLSSAEFDVKSFIDRIKSFAPKILAFNGKNAASVVFGCNTRSLRYGLQAQVIGESQIVVLPSTSGSARRYWDSKWWFDLARMVAHIR